MKKKNIFLRSALIILVMTLVGATIFAGNTALAKYTAAASGTATGKVAKWSILVEDVELGEVDIADPDIDFTDYLTINLFDTILCDGGISDDDEPEQHVTEKMIAPGTKGSLSGLVITNASDVDALIVVKVELSNAVTGVDVLGQLTITGSNWDGTTDTFEISQEVARGDDLVITDADFGWTWPMDDGTSGTNSLGIDSALLSGEGYEEDNPIGFAANTDNELITATVSIVAVQIN